MKGLWFLIFPVLILVLSSCSKHRPAPVSEISKNRYKSAKYRHHRKSYVKVKKGDTLYSIGFKNNISFKDLARINHIPAPYRIYPGQKIRFKANKSSKFNKSKRNATTKLKKTQLADKKTPIKSSTIKKAIIVKTPIASVPLIVKTPKTPIAITAKVTPKITPKKTPTKTAKTPIAHSKWIWPVKGRILSSFSESNVSRKGIDIAVSFGRPVYASNNGTVVYSGDGLRGYGELIIIKHSNNLLSAYAHNSIRKVKEGENVIQGQEIARSGKGTDGKALLHFEIRKNGKPVNPVNYLPKN